MGGLSISKFVSGILGVFFFLGFFSSFFFVTMQRIFIGSFGVFKVVIWVVQVGITVGRRWSRAGSVHARQGLDGRGSQVGIECEDK